MSILATTDTAVVPERIRLQVVRASEPVTIAWFEDLVAQHGTWLRQLVRRRMANPALVDDALQETLLRICRSTPPADARALRPWLAGIAKHTCADVWRAQLPRAARLDSVEDVVPAPRATVPGSDDHLGAVARRARINDALLRLPPRHRRLLEKQALFGMTYEEIADEEDVSIASVTSALGRARAGFRRRYADDDARSAPAWVAVLHRVADRLRVRMARTQAALVARAVELAAASFTLGVAAVLVVVPAVSSSEDATRVPDDPPSLHTSSVGRDGTSPSAAAVAPAGTSYADAVRTPPPSAPPRRPVGEIATAPPSIELTPDRWRVDFAIEVGAPHDTVHARVGTTFHCDESRVGAAACPLVAELPGAESSR